LPTRACSRATAAPTLHRCRTSRTRPSLSRAWASIASQTVDRKEDDAMKKLVFLMAVLSAAVVATPAFPQAKPELGVSFASDSLTVPVMINAGGLGTTFVTYAALMNPTSKAFPVQVTLFDSGGTKTQKTITLSAG